MKKDNETGFLSTGSGKFQVWQELKKRNE